jgi:hypothetical protein
LPVPELTRSADIQLNKRLSLRRHLEMQALVAEGHCTIRIRGHHGAALSDLSVADDEVKRGRQLRRPQKIKPSFVCPLVSEN